MKINYKTLLASIKRYDDEPTRCRDQDMLSKTIMSTVHNAPGLGTCEDYDVKLVINGVECEPLLLQNIFEDLDNYIEQEAKSLHESRFQPYQERLDELSELLGAVKDIMIDDFGVDS